MKKTNSIKNTLMLTAIAALCLPAHGHADDNISYQKIALTPDEVVAREKNLQPIYNYMSNATVARIAGAIEQFGLTVYSYTNEQIEHCNFENKRSSMACAVLDSVGQSTVAYGSARTSLHGLIDARVKKIDPSTIADPHDNSTYYSYSGDVPNGTDLTQVLENIPMKTIKTGRFSTDQVVDIASIKPFSRLRTSVNVYYNGNILKGFDKQIDQMMMGPIVMHDNVFRSSASSEVNTPFLLESKLTTTHSEAIAKGCANRAYDDVYFCSQSSYSTSETFSSSSLFTHAFLAPSMIHFLDAIRIEKLRAVDAELVFLKSPLVKLSNSNTKTATVVLYPDVTDSVLPVPRPIIFIGSSASLTDVRNMLRNEAVKIMAYNSLFDSKLLPVISDTVARMMQDSYFTSEISNVLEKQVQLNRNEQIDNEVARANAVREAVEKAGNAYKAWVANTSVQRSVFSVLGAALTSSDLTANSIDDAYLNSDSFRRQVKDLVGAEVKTIINSLK